MYQFEAEYPILFIQIDMFNILVYDIRLKHRDMCNKGNLIREFDTGDIFGSNEASEFKHKGRYRTEIGIQNKDTL